MPSPNRRSIRLPSYDYTHPGAYFVTICTWKMTRLFGEIIDGDMQLSLPGQIAKDQWKLLKKRFSHVDISSYVIMPNHMHGIILLDEKSDNNFPPDHPRGTGLNQQKFGNHYLPPHPGENPNSQNPSQNLHPQVLPGSLGAIVRAYKSSVSLRINHLRGYKTPPVWQRNYYEHIIRDGADWETIIAYIESNPARWTTDKFHQS